MGRLIDADRLKAHYAWWGEDSDKRRTFDCIVDVQPSVDAAQIKHGHWVDNNEVFVCSECGKWFDMLQGDADMNYCPNCGARMEESDG